MQAVTKAALLAGFLLTLLTIARGPDNLATPQFYGEDGALFFAEAHADGFLPTLARPTAGYLNTLPRLLAGAALLAPLERAPLVVAVLALLVQMTPVFYLLSGRAVALVPSFAGRALAALVYVVVPNSDEVFLTATNAQWHLNVAAALALLLPAPGSRLGRSLELALATVFAFTGPGGIILLPVALLRLRRERDAGQRPHALALTIVVLAGAVVQAIFLLSSQRVGAPAIPGAASLGAAQLVEILSNHALYTVFLREAAFSRCCGSFGPAQHLLGLLLLGLLAWVVVRRRQRPLMVLGYLASATVAAALLFPSNDLTQWLDPFFGPRYFFYASLFVVYAVCFLVSLKGGWRILGAALAAPLIVLGIAPAFFHATWFDTHYRDQVARFRSLPPRASFFVPTLPEGWGMTLVRGAGPARPWSPLEGLAQLPGQALHLLDPVWVSDAGDRIAISGSASDPLAKGPAGGVLLVVDGRPFPAAYGRAWSPRSAGGGDAAGARFHRIIPVAEIGRGEHEVSVVVLSRDRRGYFAPAGSAVFALP